MISLLESSAQVVGVVLVWYNKSTTLSNLILAIIVFDILLPHVFLMNTSENKNRIVELGWKNVFKNTLGISNNSVGNFENKAAVHIGRGDSEIKREQKKKKITTSKHQNNLDTEEPRDVINLFQ